jgi:glycosyltransferase involved in cell wall biosynthesis
MDLANTTVYSVIVPVYNTSRSLLELQRRLDFVFNRDIKQPYELLWVDDGSTNYSTWPTIEELVADYENNFGIQLDGNFGQHAALICGITHAKGRFIITMDDDLQHAPEDIPVLIQSQEHDVVIGQFAKRKHSLVRNIGSYVKSFFDRIVSGKPKGLRVSTFCLFRRAIAEKILAQARVPLPLFSTMMFRSTSDIIGVDVSHSIRKEGKSGYTINKLLTLFVKMFVRQSKSTVVRPSVFIVKQRIHQPQNIN